MSSIKDFRFKSEPKEPTPIDEVELIGSNIDRAKKQLVKRLDEDWISSNRSKSLGEALKNLSGVTTLQTGTTISKPIIQGMRGSRIITVSNGTRQEDMEWGDEHAPSIQMGSFDEIKIEKGANALAYGTDAIGGVIVLDHQKFYPVDSERREFGTGYHTNGRGGYIFHQIKKTNTNGSYFKSSLNYQRFGDRTAPNYNLTNTGNKSQSVNLIYGKNKLSTGWELNFSLLLDQIGILRSSHIGNLDDLERSINSRTPLYIEDFRYDIYTPKQDILHGTFSGSYFKNLTEKLLLWTGERWIISLSKNDNAKSIFEMNMEDKTNNIEAFKKSHIAKDIEELFPDAKLIDVQEEKNE